ncbi:MAG: hypothetical protein ACPGSB_12195 [Opitutales bacterium]
MDCESSWKKVIEIHNHTKRVFLWAEEMETIGFRDFVQPINEHRHAWEHVVRARANELGLDAREPNTDYQETNLNKALGHEYRAFFDSADWLAVIIREDILKVLKPYSPKVIAAGFPDYYPTVRVRLDEINQSIADKRMDKDIAAEMMLQSVEEYREVLDELVEIRKTVYRQVPSLQDFREADRRSFLVEKIGLPVVIGIAVAVIAYNLLN